MSVNQTDRAIFTALYKYFEKYDSRQLTPGVFCLAADEMILLVSESENQSLARCLFFAAYDYFGEKYGRERKAKNAAEINEA